MPGLGLKIRGPKILLLASVMSSNLLNLKTSETDGQTMVTDLSTQDLSQHLSHSTPHSIMHKKIKDDEGLKKISN